MEGIKILLVLFTSVLIKKSSYALSADYTEESISEVCTCFNTTNLLVSEELDPESNGLERFVIYLYNNIKTGQVHVYTPNREKQINFPDLSFDMGDKLHKTNSYLLYQLLHPIQNFATGSKDVPQGLANPSLNDIFFKNETGQQIINGETKNEVVIGHFDLPKELNIHQVSNDSSTKFPYFIDNYVETDKQYTTESKIFPAEGQSHSHSTKDLTDYVSSTDIPLNLDSIAYLVKDKSVPVVTNDDANDYFLNSNKVIPKLENHLNGKDDFFINQQNIPKKSSNQKYSTKDVKYLDPQLSEFKNLFGYGSGAFLGFSQPAETIIKESMFIASDHTQSNLPGLLFTFDKWFDQQMRRINSTSKSSNRNIDLHSLKLLIEKTLYENQMYVTKDGVLIDTYGNALNVANLKLQPILIGNSVPYTIILNVKNNRIELPTDVEFLQAILVAMVFPPKVLGVIPLGNANVPNVSYRRRFNFWSTLPNKSVHEPLYIVRQFKHKKKTHYTHDHNNKLVYPTIPGTLSANLKVLSPENSYTSKENRFTVYKNPLYEKDKPYTKNTHVFAPLLDSISSFNGVIAKHDKWKESEENQGTRNNYQSILKLYGDDQFDKRPAIKISKNGKDVISKTISSLFNIHDQIMKNDKGKKSEKKKGSKNNNQSIRKLYGVDQFDEEPELEDIDEQGLPGFRIIGGAPATGSGTPVVSRGRSGA